MELTVVGCSGSFPGPDSPASCYLLEHDGSKILLDLGNGALGPLARYSDLYDIDAVIVSHLHVDHFIDLCSYHVARKYHPDGPVGPVPVFAPQGAAKRVADSYGLADAGQLAAELDFQDLLPTFEVGPFRIDIARGRHPVEAYAIRVTADDRSVTYSGDTGPCDDLVDLAKGTNLALFEASFVSSDENPPDLHLTAGEAGEHARRADAERLLATHLVPWNSLEQVQAEAEREFPGVRLATPGLRILI